MATSVPTFEFTKAIGLYRKQAEFVTNPGMFSLFVGGVGSGKSVALTARVLYKMLANPGVRGALLGRTGKDLDSVLLPALLEHLQHFQDHTGINWVRDYNKGRGEITLINGASVLCRPYTQVNKLAGLTLGWVAADEIAWSSVDEDRLWQVLTGRMRAHCPSPSLDFATSPNGNRGIVAKFVDAQRRGDSRYWITTATSLDNPFLPETYLAGLETMSKRAYAQEVLGKVLRPLSGVYDLTPEHFLDWNWRQYPHFPFVGGWDIGGDNHHACVLFQVVTEPTIAPDGRELAPGTWIACDELIGDEMPRNAYRSKLLGWLREHGAHRIPYLFFDRAVPNEGSILQGQLQDSWIKSLDHKHEQYVENGIELVRDGLDPIDHSPWILFSNSLNKLDPPQGKTAGVVSGMRNYRYMLDVNRNPTNKPLKDNTNDHACLVAGSLVSTLRGQIPIELVTVNDRVITRRGYGVVVAVAMTDPDAEIFTVECSDGTNLTADAHQKVWVEGEGWVAIDSLQPGDPVCSLKNLGSLCLTGSDFAGNRIQSCPAIASTTDQQVGEAPPSTCTGMCGRKPMVRSPKGGMFTTLTETLSTMRSRICSVCRKLTTVSTMRTTGNPMKGNLSTLNGSAPSPNSGTHPQRGELGTVDTASKLPQTGCCSHTPASSAESLSNPPKHGQNTVTSTANSVLCTPHKAVYAAPALNAEGNLTHTGATKGSPVRRFAAIVTTVKPAGRAPVFTLQVEPQHEYFANGILVANCDSLRMAWVGSSDLADVHGGMTLSQHSNRPTGTHQDGKSGNLVPHF